MNNNQRKKFIEEEFVRQFGHEPEYWSRAPGRVDLMGSHTDYNLGFVMTMTIDRDTWIAARPRFDRIIRISSLNFAGTAEFGLENITRVETPSWSNYVRGLVKVFLDGGYEFPGFNGLIHSTVPLGSGLSSSAALEMAVAETLQQIGNFKVEPVEKALIGQKAENQFVGVNSGILDQYSSAMGREGCAILLDCRALTSKPVKLANDLQVVICDTNAPRTLVGSEYDERREHCEAGVEILSRHFPEISALRDVSMEQFDSVRTEMPDVVRRRCQFILEENQRVLDLAVPLQTGDRDQLHALFHESYLGARDLYEIIVPEMTHMLGAMLDAPGVIGARQAGAGFGGCMIALVDPVRLNDFTDFVQVDYFERSGNKPEVFRVVPMNGAAAIN